MGWTRENIRHAVGFLKQGVNPAATVYDSIGPNFPLALAPGWLNLGLWEDENGDPRLAADAVRRLVERVASPLPVGGVILDVGNGLGAQDRVIAEVTDPRRLIALNVTLSQLRSGRENLARARAVPMLGDATRIPLGSESVDGVISVEAAFHFASRSAFFREAARVLRPGGVLSMSDVPTERLPRDPLEALAGITQLRVWGLRPGAAESTDRIASLAEDAGFVNVEVDLCGDRVIGPAIRFIRRRLPEVSMPRSQKAGVRFVLSQVELLWRRGLIDYLLLSATRL